MKTFITIVVLALVCISSVKSMDTSLPKIDWVEVKDELMSMNKERFLELVQEAKELLFAPKEDPKDRTLASTYVAGTSKTITADVGKNCSHCTNPKWSGSSLFKFCKRTCTSNPTCPVGDDCNCLTWIGLSTVYNLKLYCYGKLWGSSAGSAIAVLLIILIVIY